ncbi:MAG: hypothetical protein AAFX79_00405 [Planctomycetota bacterium]
MTPAIRRWLRLGVLAASMLGVAAHAQIPEDLDDEPADVQRPAAISRIVRHFDFEEQAINPIDVPLYWVRAQHDPEVRDRPRYPLANLAALDYAAAAASGFGSARLRTAGGSTSLRLQPGVIPVFPSVRYAIGAMVRTEGLTHARPRLIGRLLDADGTPIPGAEASYTAPLSENGFTPLLLQMPPAPEDAVSLQIDLELAQPRELGGTQANDYTIWNEDFEGAAWFDDVVVVQLPTASLEPAEPTGLFVGEERPSVRVRVRDLSGDPITVTLRAVDDTGRIVDERIEQIGAGVWTLDWRPTLPALGWYHAEMTIGAGGVPMVRSGVSFAWMPELSPLATLGSAAAVAVDDPRATRPVVRAELYDRKRLGLVAPATPAAALAVLPEFVRKSGARAIALRTPLDGEATSEGSGDGDAPLAWAEEAQWSLQLLRRLGVQPTAILMPRPAITEGELASDGDLALRALEDPTLWTERIVPLTDLIGDAVRRWHIGPLGSEAHAAGDQNTARLAAAGARLQRLRPGVIVGVPWSGEFVLDGVPLAATGGDAMLTVSVPGHASPETIAELGGRLADMGPASDEPTEGRAIPAPVPARVETTMVLQPMDEESFGRRAAVRHLVGQMLEFWRGLPETPTDRLEADGPVHRLALADGWAWRTEGVLRAEPTARLAAWRAVGDRLAGTRFVRAFTTADGIECMVFRRLTTGLRDEGGLVVLRRHSAPRGGDPAPFELYLGEDPVTVYDAYGNHWEVPEIAVHEPFAETPRQVHRIAVDEDPVFVEGVDIELLLFLASLRLEPDLLPAIDIEHEVALVVQNQWPTTTSIRSRIVSPGGFAGRSVAQRDWEISPRLSDLVLSGAEERRVPITVRFRRSEQAGRKMLGLELDVRGERSAERLRVDVPFRIGLPYLEVDATGRRSPGGGVVVTAVIRNIGQRPLTLDLTALAPGVARARMTIAELPPGGTARRELVLREVRGAQAGAVTLSVEDVAIGARLNYDVDLP